MWSGHFPITLQNISQRQIAGWIWRSSSTILLCWMTLPGWPLAFRVLLGSGVGRDAPWLVSLVWTGSKCSRLGRGLYWQEIKALLVSPWATLCQWPWTIAPGLGCHLMGWWHLGFFSLDYSISFYYILLRCWWFLISKQMNKQQAVSLK